MKRTTKNNRTVILNHLRQSGHISTIEGFIVHKIARIAPRIQELRERGHIIDTQFVKDEAGDNYTRYVFTGFTESGYSGFIKGEKASIDGTWAAMKVRFVAIRHQLHRQAYDDSVIDKGCLRETGFPANQGVGYLFSLGLRKSAASARA